MKISEANKLTLRPVMDVIVSVDETPDKASGVTSTNIMTTYASNARVIEAGTVVTLMDLCNGGFVNNGNAQPITTETLPDKTKYGYIASAYAMRTVSSPIRLWSRYRLTLTGTS